MNVVLIFLLVSPCRKPVQSSNSFKEEKRNPGSSQPYRRTVSDSNQRLPAHTSIPVSQSPDIIRK